LQIIFDPWGVQTEGSAWSSFPFRAEAERLTQRRFLIPGYLCDRYFLGERVLDTHLPVAERRIPHDPPFYMYSSGELATETRIAAITGEPAEARIGTVPGDFAAYFEERMFSKVPFGVEATEPQAVQTQPTLVRNLNFFLFFFNV